MLPEREAHRLTPSKHTGARYQPPDNVGTVGLWKLLEGVRTVPDAQRARLGLPGVIPPADGPSLWTAGDLELVRRKAVAIVGSRKVSAEGARRARRLARELVSAGVVVVSGLAEGVDTNAHEAAIDADGKTIAVIGTPIDRVFPAANARLQEAIYRKHLLVTPFGPGSNVFKGNFPHRNKIMATISDATVIIEASDTSGSLHQAAECHRLGRWLFIARSVVDDPRLTWPKKFLPNERTRILSSTDDILAVI
jgi:DNA processing protein